MKNTLFKWPWASVVVLSCILFLTSSCKTCNLFGGDKNKETVLLIPDLHLMAQWNKEVDLNDRFYAKLDAMAAMPSVGGAVLRKELDVYEKERREIYLRNGVLAEQIRRIGPVSTTFPGPKPPPPPPPIIDPDGRFRARIEVIFPVRVPGRLVLYSSEGADEFITIRMGKEEWNSKSTAFKREELAGGIVKFTFDASTFKSGLGELVIGDVNGGAPTIVELEFIAK